ncbi:ABC transporter permease subunit [Verrucomicrobiota bacterium]
MRNFFTIWRKELAAHFLSPIAYVIMMIFLSITNWLFLMLVENNGGSSEPLSVFLFRVILFLWMPVLAAVITMRLFAEERRSGTIETLMTAPVTETEVVLGKYAGALCFLLLITAPAISSVFLLKILCPGISYLDLGALTGGIIIFFLLSIFCTSVGVFFSLISRNPIISVVCSLCGMWLMLLAGDILVSLPKGTGKVVEYIYSGSHILDFARGSIDTRPVVLYLSGAVLMLFTSVRLLEFKK